MSTKRYLVILRGCLLAAALLLGVYGAFILIFESDLRDVASWLAFIPYATAAVVCGGVIGISIIWPFRRRMADVAIPEGRCQECGYDLRATPASCSECGSQATAPADDVDKRNSLDPIFIAPTGHSPDRSKLCVGPSGRMKHLRWIRPLLIVVIVGLGYRFLVLGSYIAHEDALGLTEQAVRERFGEPRWIWNDDGQGQADWSFSDGLRTSVLSFQSGVVVHVHHFGTRDLRTRHR